ncbi:MAG TPA: bifunctional folylpolyglutamate synthase/dihydrofolate synthase, partial [Clostridia bacterium]|nr:bifunctional folylpolyglutamate synthase/dihydrofolate synthase [Clostridia bacterium]
STCAMVSSMLQLAGYRVGMFISPHLHSYTERMRIDGKDIPRETIARLLTRMRPLLEKMVQEGYEHPTEFEVNTALALQYFFEEKVDFAILEVGLGGAIDSTNVVNPLVAVITNVGMDHMEYLGNTLEEITRIKGGIIKPGSLVVTASSLPWVLQVLEDISRQQKARLIKVGEEIRPTLLTSSLQGITFDVQGPGWHYNKLAVPLIGEHQVQNGATAVTVIECLKEQGYSIPEEAVRQGLGQVVWPARLEVLAENPIVLVDIAHNVDGAVTLRQSLEKIFHYRRLILVVGMLADKERKKFMDILAPLANILIITKPNSPRAEGWEELATMAGNHVARIEVYENSQEAVRRGLELAQKEDLLCITGSLYLVADAREMLLKNNNVE